MHEYSVCFVCTGNICRSPMAEAVFRARIAEAGLDGQVVTSSAGTGGWHAGDPADPRTAALLEETGYELDHVARQFVRDGFAGHDLVVALDEGHARELRALAPTPGDEAKIRLLRGYDPTAAEDDGFGFDVPDPYYGGPEGFEECLRLVEAAVPGLIAEVAATLEQRAGDRGDGGAGDSGGSGAGTAAHGGGRRDNSTGRPLAGEHSTGEHP
ncbi:protein tyrosine phosphatase [Streptomyces sp. WMMB 714]|uniref:low molecular weight protein-tyrosine-phosphatase n=1 Tax=Streptomyces sp. WMMB 714 TaxID=1286822 RepID=UPI000823F651|nr:low molecular weight protein-tyrosine-phosphatase [Streptomyces sp. WMMB 714]SCK22051.1 protein tyrosine phosphatase [Streptomyces sp. WMMB 714]